MPAGDASPGRCPSSPAGRTRRSKALSDFAAYVALEAEATWAPIREKTNRVVEEAFRRRLRS